jgi:hypothetical protein
MAFRGSLRPPFGLFCASTTLPRSAKADLGCAFPLRKNFIRALPHRTKKIGLDHGNAQGLVIPTAAMPSCGATLKKVNQLPIWPTSTIFIGGRKGIESGKQPRCGVHITTEKDARPIEEFLPAGRGTRRCQSTGQGALEDAAAVTMGLVVEASSGAAPRTTTRDARRPAATDARTLPLLPHQVWTYYQLIQRVGGFADSGPSAGPLSAVAVRRQSPAEVFDAGIAPFPAPRSRRSQK